MQNNFLTKNTINKIYQRRSHLIKSFKDVFLTPKQKKFYKIAELPNHWEYETIFQCIMESWLIDKNKKIQYEDLIKTNKRDMSSELYKIKPLENLNILEIGGYFVLNLERLGAKTIKKDSAIDEKEYITLKNYKSQLKDSFFDISFSKELFDQHSGIDDNKDFNQACREMLTVFANITKRDGISIHEGSMIEIVNDNNFLESIGFKLIAILEGKRIGPVYDVYVFEKIN